MLSVCSNTAVKQHTVVISKEREQAGADKRVKTKYSIIFRGRGRRDEKWEDRLHGQRDGELLSLP